MPRHLLDIRDLSTQELDDLMDRADDIIQNPKRYAECMHGKKLATLFYEPSTRTRLSFEAAMLELGGSVLGFSSADSSSASKGESVADTVRTVGCYADVIAMRHPKEGAPTAAAQVSPVPIINAGDGGHNHPTQTLADLLTIRREKGRLNQLVIGCCGDLQFGRTVHSLINAMMRYKSIRFVLTLSGGAARARICARKHAQKRRQLRGSGAAGGCDRHPRYSLHDPCAARALL